MVENRRTASVPGFTAAIEADQLLTAIVESSDDAIISKDLNGVITSWNGGAERIFGYTAAEVIGKPVNILIPHDRQDEEPGILDRIRRGIRVDHFETVRRRKDGSLIDVALTISPVRDSQGRIVGASKIARAISERKESERMRRLLSAIVESSEDAIASKDLNGILTSWNKGAERLLGYAPDEAIGKSVTMLIPADRQSEEQEILSRLRIGERIENFRTVRQRKDGSLVDVSLTVSPIKDEHGNVVGASKILRDITESVRATERLEEMVAVRTAQLRETVAELEAFSYSVAHDMRAPLRAMVSYARILEKEGGDFSPGERQDFLRRIIDGGLRLDALITDVLNYSKVARGEMPLETVDLEKMVLDIIDSYPQLRSHSENIAVSFPLPRIRANVAALTQCLSNLLTNAIKFVPPGRRPSVHVRAEPSGDKVRIWVEDNGIGISPEDLKRIFGLFQRLNAADQFEGTGIGLTIVRKAAERMGGRVGVESESGAGSRFWIELAAA